MRFLRVGCIGLTLAVLVVYGVVISIPLEREWPAADAGLAALAEREQKRKPQLKEPALNGFIHPKLEAFWARGEDGSGSVSDTVIAWTTAYSQHASGHPVPHATLLKARDPAYIKARNAFGALLPELAEAFSKPLFYPPNEGSGEATVSLRYPAVQFLTMGLSAYAESLIAEGNSTRAALVYELIFRVGYLVAVDTTIVQTMVGVSLQALGFQSFVAHLSPAAELTAQQWAGLSNSIAASTPTPVTFTMALQNDLAQGIAFLNLPRSSFDGDGRALRGTYLLPGLRSRDIRVFSSLMDSLLVESVSRGQIKQATPGTGWRDFLSGSSGPGTALLVPRYDQQSARLNLHAAKMSGLAATTGANAYRATHGKLPSRLADLDSLGLKAPGGQPWSAVKGVVYQSSGKNASIGVRVSPDQFALAGIDVPTAQQSEAQNSSYFRLQPDGFLFQL